MKKWRFFIFFLLTFRRFCYYVNEKTAEATGKCGALTKMKGLF